jgi:surface antigen
LAGTIVLGGSMSHSARLTTISAQGGYGSVLDQAAAADVAAKVADQANLIVAKEATSTASTLNSQVSMVTSGDDTLAARQVVDTAGATSKDIHSYKVQPGDTLGSIAAQFNITSDTIRWANNIDGDTLKPGQNLVILPISGIQHTVAAGETADGLAAKYQSNAEQIIAFNDAEVKGLQVGSTIVIPDGVIQQAKPAAAAAVTVASSAPRLTRFAGNGNGYSFGYCTYYVASRRSVPGNWGNASSWYYNAQLDGFSVGSTPVPGAIAWTGAGYYGHVAYVESVSGGMVTVSEMNYNGNWDRVTYRTVPASSFRYIY